MIKMTPPMIYFLMVRSRWQVIIYSDEHVIRKQESDSYGIDSVLEQGDQVYCNVAARSSFYVRRFCKWTGMEEWRGMAGTADRDARSD